MAKYLIFARQLLYCCLLIAGLVVPARSLAQTPQIVGPDTVCVGQNSSYTLAPMGPIPYIWTLSGGGTWTANSNPTFNVTWTTPGTHTVINLHGPTFTFNNYSVCVLPTPDLSITSDFEVGCMSIAVDSPRKEGGGLTQDMLDDGACSKVCENSIVRYYATGATGAFGPVRRMHRGRTRRLAIRSRRRFSCSPVLRSSSTPSTATRVPRPSACS